MSANTRKTRNPRNPQPDTLPQPPATTAAFPAPSFDPDVSLTRPQAAAFLAISEALLKKLDLDGRGPAAYRIGRRWTYQRKDLLAWREAFRVEGLLTGLPLVEPAQVDPDTLPPPFPAETPPPRKRGRRPLSEGQREAA